jgi:nitrogen regulatory protein PII
MKKLIITIINRGYADELMLAAREVGARGGTIVNARGTVTEDNSEFFGISLTPEKEMLLIIAYADEVSNIVNAIKSRPVFSQRGAGIVFTLNIEEAFFE